MTRGQTCRHFEQQLSGVSSVFVEKQSGQVSLVGPFTHSTRDGRFLTTGETLFVNGLFRVAYQPLLSWATTAKEREPIVRRNIIRKLYQSSFDPGRSFGPQLFRTSSLCPDASKLFSHWTFSARIYLVTDFHSCTDNAVSWRKLAQCYIHMRHLKLLCQVGNASKRDQFLTFVDCHWKEVALSKFRDLRAIFPVWILHVDDGRLCFQRNFVLENMLGTFPPSSFQICKIAICCPLNK